MTVSTTDNVKIYTGDNSTVAFSFPYLFYADSHLKVYLDGVLKTITTHYTVTGAENPAGGTVTFLTAPGTGVEVVIQRVVPLTQNTDLENFDGNPADVTETQFDLLAMVDQQLTESIERSILAPLGTTLTTNAISGTIDATARLITITTSGPAIGPTVASFDTATATAVAAAATATTQAGLASTAKTNAETAETNAESQVTYAEEWAQNPEDDPVSVAAGGDDSTTYSALHWAAKAFDFAQSVNLPALGAANTVLQVNAAGNALEYEKVKALNVDINAATDTVITASDEIWFADATDTNLVKKDTVQGILDLVSAGGWVPIKTVTASNVATVDFVNGSGGVVLDGTYAAYAVVLSGVLPATDTTNLLMRTSTNAGSSYDSGGTDYIYSNDGQNSAANSPAINENTGSSSLLLAQDISNTANERGVDGALYFGNPATAAKFKVHGHLTFIKSDSSITNVSPSGARVATTDVDAIRFLMASGNVSGTFTLYGLKSAA